MNTTKVIGIISSKTSIEYAHSYPGFGCPTTSRQVVIVTEEAGSYDNKETSAAHEVGHTYGLCDEYNVSRFPLDDMNKTINSGGCPNGDKNEDGLLDSECNNTYGIYGLKGCPVENQDLILDFFFKDKNVDYLINMYGSRPAKSSNISRWINNQTYNQLLHNLTGQGNVICTDKELIIISGDVNKSYNLSLNNFYRIKGGCYFNETITDTLNETFILRVAQKGIGTQILNLLKWTIIFRIFLDDGDTVEIDNIPFVITMPYNENTTSFEFINQSNNVSLAIRNKTTNTPILNITYPFGNVTLLQNTFNITWNSSDADNDTVYHVILVSSNNGTDYNTLDIDNNNTYYEIDPSEFEYSEEYVVKILATDGVNTNSSVSNIFTMGTPELSVISLQEIYENGTERIYEFTIENNETKTLSNIAWSFSLGNGIIMNSTQNISLESGESTSVYVKYTYASSGNYVVNATLSFKDYKNSQALGSETNNLLITDISEIYSSSFDRIYEFTIRNNGSTTMSNINWTLNTQETTFYAKNLITLNSSEEINVLVSYTFSGTGDFIINATAFNSVSSYSRIINSSVNLLDVSNLAVLNSSGSQRIFEFFITNKMNTTLANINWSLKLGNNISINSTQLTSLLPNNNTFVYVSYTYPSSGSYLVNATARNNTVQDSDTININI
jgi:hypothetical protein